MFLACWLVKSPVPRGCSRRNHWPLYNWTACSCYFKSWTLMIGLCPLTSALYNWTACSVMKLLNKIAWQCVPASSKWLKSESKKRSKHKPENAATHHARSQPIVDNYFYKHERMLEMKRSFSSSSNHFVRGNVLNSWNIQDSTKHVYQY